VRDPRGRRGPGLRDASATGQDAIVLLSPACASFDQFPDFEVRGDAFRAAVRELAQSSGKVAPAKPSPAQEMRG